MSEFTGNYEDQLAYETDKSIEIIHKGLQIAAEGIMNQLSEQALELGERAKKTTDPIEKIKMKAAVDGMRNALAHYGMAFSKLGMNVVGDLPMDFVKEHLAMYAERTLTEN